MCVGRRSIVATHAYMYLPTNRTNLHNMTTRRIRNALMAVIAIMTMVAGAITADAANLVVRNFKMLPTDQTAINRETMKRDQNGKTSALIKIYTPLNEEQTYFDNGVMGVVARINKPGQIWLYIPARSQSIQIINSKYSPLTYFFDEEIGGDTARVSNLAPGIYIVGNQKIMIK